MKKQFPAVTMIFTLVLSSLLTGCGKKPDDTALQPENPMQTVTPHLVNTDTLNASDMHRDTVSATDFAVRLFQESINTDENTLISPYSVLTALAMTANGADGETLAQMEQVLGLPVDELNTYLYLYQNSLPAGDKYKVSSANSIWLKEEAGLVLQEDFLQILTDYYHAEVYKAPFDNATLKDVNRWVETNTDGMVKDILPEISPSDILYLINAIAFDAEWQSIYTDTDIREAYFTKEDTTRQSCELMYSSEYEYIEDIGATGFLKYYADGKYAFAALLPDESTSVTEYASTLTGEKLNKLLTDTKEATVKAAIPKFEAEYFVQMNELLQNMGMTDAFDGSLADFSRLADGGLSIDRVLHKAFISVDEKGTKAGAATAVAVKESCMIEENIKTVYLDRPFIYLLIDCENKLPIFIGAVTDMK